MKGQVRGGNMMEISQQPELTRDIAEPRADRVTARLRPLWHALKEIGAILVRDPSLGLCCRRAAVAIIPSSERSVETA